MMPYVLLLDASCICLINTGMLRRKLELCAFKNSSNARAVASRRNAESEKLMNAWNWCSLALITS